MDEIEKINLADKPTDETTETVATVQKASGGKKKFIILGINNFYFIH